MIDIIGAIVLTTLAVAGAGAVILTSPLERAQAARLIVIAAAWFAVVAALAAGGVFGTLGAPAIGVTVLAPIVLIALGAVRLPSVRAVAFGAPLALLVVLHVGRLLGAFFLLLHADGRLPATFALGAGWGDIAIAALALPVAWMVARRMAFWRSATLVWSAVGFVDLVAAVTLGVGSTPDFPGTMATLPWALIPGFLVPLYLLAHIAVLVRLFAWERAARPAVAAR